MKKCMRCDIIYHIKTRTRCLYCNSLLMYMEEGQEKADDPYIQEVFEETPGKGKFFFKKEKIILDQVLRDSHMSGLGHIEYVIGNYFRSRTLRFMYFFCRDEMKIGKKYKRFLVFPLSFSAILIIPWVVLDLFDSLFFRILYTKHCPKCDWKYSKEDLQGGHYKAECEYNQEYSAIVSDILSGEIVNTEQQYQNHAIEMASKGRKSAYYYLCLANKKASSFFDIFCIWGSIVVWLSFLVCVVFPVLYVVLTSFDLQTIYLR